MSPASSQNGAGTYNLDQAAADARAEAEGGAPFRFTYKGKKYTVPPAMAWPIRAQSDLLNGRLEQALSVLIGEKEYQQLARDGMINAELVELFNELGRNSGTGDLPNSLRPARPASTRT